MCTPSISSFLGYTYSYFDQNGVIHNVTTVDLAKWVSYQSYISPNVGALPVSLVVVQWGLEWGWSGSSIAQYRNMANQGGSCGFAVCGSYGGGVFPTFCTVPEAVRAYGSLIINGYPHVQYPWYLSGGGSSGMQQCAINLGQGYQSGVSLSGGDYCGGPCPAISSSCPRIWDAGHYDDGGGPGSQVYDTINYSGNGDCLPNLNFIQTLDPGLGF